MGSEKRERKKANRAAKRAAEQAAEARARRLRTIRNVVLFGAGIIVVAVLLSLAGCSSDDDEPNAAGSTTTEQGGPPTDVDDDGAPATTGDDGPPAYGSGECPPAEGVDEPVIDFDDAPALCIDPARTYTARFETTEGDFTVELAAAENPITVNNFVVLARYGYYDGTDLFRTEATTGIIQGGSPHTQSNTDPGPGYTIRDENLPFSSDDYGPGALAMARTALPHSASGQFFLLANEGARYLGDPTQLGDAAGSYVVFGQTTEGLEVLEAIAALDDGRRQPSRQVTVEKVTITES
jgi:peptidyl-prolyl cis-trans isomerase B (cyclophilin B)